MSGADVVTGPVLARFQQPPPDWVVEGAFFDPPRHATGSEVQSAYTNNVLVRADALAALSQRFDERLRVGEDSELFERLRAGGSRIVWCATCSSKLSVSSFVSGMTTPSKATSSTACYVHRESDRRSVAPGDLRSYEVVNPLFLPSDRSLYLQ